jgi:hypothetical protein
MNEHKTDAELVAKYRFQVIDCDKPGLSDWRDTSLHIPAGDLDRLVKLAEQGLKYRPEVVDDKWDALIRAAYREADEHPENAPQWPTDTDPDTARLTFDQPGDPEWSDYLGESNG